MNVTWVIRYCDSSPHLQPTFLSHKSHVASIIEPRTTEITLVYCYFLTYTLSKYLQHVKNWMQLKVNYTKSKNLRQWVSHLVSAMFCFAVKQYIHLSICPKKRKKLITLNPCFHHCCQSVLLLHNRLLKLTELLL